MIEIKRASDCVNDIRNEMTELFIEGFWHLLQLLSKDRNKLKEGRNILKIYDHN